MASKKHFTATKINVPSRNVDGKQVYLQPDVQVPDNLPAAEIARLLEAELIVEVKPAKKEKAQAAKTSAPALPEPSADPTP
ncbi:MAG: hypothetical protein ABIQ01_02205 [Pseudolysinimonas sp.]